MKLRLFGPPLVLHKEEKLSFRSAKVKALLAFLAMNADQEHSRSVLAAMFWGDRPEKSAQANFRSALARLRSSLAMVLEDEPEEDGPLLKVTRQILLLRLDKQRHWVDALAFLEYWEQCQHFPREQWGDVAECLAALHRAVECYRGPFLEGLWLEGAEKFEEWRLTQSESFQSRYMLALEILGSHALERGALDEASGYAWQQLVQEPWCEPAHRILMQRYARDGQRRMALLQYERCCRVLMDELGIEPDTATVELYEQLLYEEEDKDEDVIPLLPPHNLSRFVTSFEGRVAELQEGSKILETHRFITIIGGGGVGKTRFAQELAWSVLSRFSHGGFFLPLSRLKKVSELPFAIARALGFTFLGKNELLEELCDFLQRRKTLLILDNLEHFLLDEEQGDALAQTILRLLERAPELTIVATSQERLGVMAEQLFPLDNLPVPDEGEPEDVQRESGSVRLFLQRAKQHTTEEQLPDLSTTVQLCRLLGGLPLGIELAASLCRERTGQELLSALLEDLHSLRTHFRDVLPRHRSLRATFDYVCKWLPESLRKSLASCAVFRGSFSLEAAKSVASLLPEQLRQLKDRSLLLSRHGRFETSHLVRGFAKEMLQAFGHDAEVQQQHATFYVEQLESFYARYQQDHSKESLQALLLDFENIEDTWFFVLEQKQWALAFRALHGAFKMFELASLYPSAVTFAEKTLSVLDDQSAGEEGLVVLRCEMLLWRASFLILQQKYQEARADLEQVLGSVESSSKEWCSAKLLEAQLMLQAKPTSEEARELLEELSPTIKHSDWAFNHTCVDFLLGRQALRARDMAKADEFFASSMDTARRHRNASQLILTESSQGASAFYKGDYTQALKCFQGVHERALRLGSRGGEARAILNIGLLASRQGQIQKSITCSQRTLQLQEKTGNVGIRSYALGELAHAYIHIAQYELAEECIEQALHIERSIADRYSESRTLMRRVELYHYTHRYSEALEAGHGALALAKDIGSEDKEVEAHMELATIYHLISARDKMAFHINEYMKVVDLPSLLSPDRAEWLHRRSLWAYDQKDAAEAIRFAQEAIESTKDLDDLLCHARVQYSLGYALLLNEQWQEAFDAFEKSKELRLSQEQPHRVPVVLVGAAWALYQWGKQARAENMFEECLSLLQKHPSWKTWLPLHTWELCIKLQKELGSEDDEGLLSEAKAVVAQRAETIFESDLRSAFEKQNLITLLDS